MLKQLTGAAALSLILAGAALAAPPPGPGPGTGWHRHGPAADQGRLKAQLDLKAGQQSAWDRFTDAVQAMHRRPARPVPPTTAGLTPAPKVFAGFADRAADKAKRARRLADAADGLYKVLTPRQRAVLDTHIADMHAMFRHHRGRFNHRGGERRHRAGKAAQPASG